MLNSFAERIEKEDVISADDKILLAVSGGVDSMVLFDLFYRLGYSISVAHCNFSLRAEDSIKDMELVERVAKERNVPFFKVIFDTEKEILLRKISLQETARVLRYQWFDKLVKEHKFNKVAVAHNQDDNIETLFINLVRGTGVRGLTGIPKVNGYIVRPIIGISREEILSYANEYRVDYRNDASNATTKYLRNKIRHDIVPQFRECNSSFDRIMADNIDRLKDSVDFIDSIVGFVSSKVISRSENSVEIDLALLWQHPSSDYLLREILCEWKVDSDVVKSIVASYNCANSGRIFHAPNHKILLDRDTLFLFEKGVEISLEEVKLSKNTEEVVFGKTKIVFLQKSFNDLSSIKVGRDSAVFDYDKLGDLTLRSWQDGDDFVPFGMKGRKKISDLFTDLKIAVNKKSSIPILLSDNDIIWVVGLRSDDRFKVDKSTKRVLYCTVESF